MTLSRVVILCALAVAFSGCATSFRGSAHISESECRTECQAIGTRMAAYVFVGRYSTACVCEPLQRSASASGLSGASVVPAVAGVWVQMQEAQRRQQQQ